jgi:hypothetical protein
MSVAQQNERTERCMCHIVRFGVGGRLFIDLIIYKSREEALRPEHRCNRQETASRSSATSHVVELELFPEEGREEGHGAGDGCGSQEGPTTSADDAEADRLLDPLPDLAHARGNLPRDEQKDQGASWFGVYVYRLFKRNLQFENLRIQTPRF